MDSGNVYKLLPDTVSQDTVKCLTTLLTQARQGNLTGIAFVGYVKGHGFIANAAGDAHRNPVLTRGMLPDLSEKLGKLDR